MHENPQKQPVLRSQEHKSGLDRSLFRSRMLQVLFAASLTWAAGCKKECPALDPEFTSLSSAVTEGMVEGLEPINSTTEGYQSKFIFDELGDLSKRLRGDKNYGKTGEFNFQEGRVTFTSSTMLWERLMQLYPDAVECIDQNYDVDVKSMKKRKKARENRERALLRMLEGRHQLSLSGDFDAVGMFTSEYQDINPEDLLNEQELTIAYPEFLEGDGNYIQIAAHPEDDLIAMLDKYSKHKFKQEQLKELAEFIVITSPDGAWNLPRVIFSSASKDDLFWIEFKEMDSYTTPDPALKSSDKRVIAKKGRQKQQNQYHAKYGYPIFTDENSEELIEQYSDQMVRTEIFMSGIYGTDDIYSCRESAEDHASASMVFLETYEVMTRLSEKVNEVYHTHHAFPENLQIEVVVTSVGRTVEYQEELVAGCASGTDPDAARQAARTKLDKNGMPKKVSSHVHHNAIDISATRVVVRKKETGALIEVDYIQHPNFMAGVVAIMHAELAQMIRDGEALGVMETGWDSIQEKRVPTTFHVVGKREEPLPGQTE